MAQLFQFCTQLRKKEDHSHFRRCSTGRTSVAFKRINDRAADLITTHGGNVILTRHCTVTKTMRCDDKGVDAPGKPIQGVLLSDKQ